MSTTHYTDPSGAPRRSIVHDQIDPSDGYAYYKIADDSRLLAEVVVTLLADPSPTGTAMAQKTEYWKIAGDALDTSGYSTLYVTKQQSGEWGDPRVGRPPFNAADASFTTPVDVTWGGAASVSCHKASGSDYGFVVDVRFRGGKWRGMMNFYRSTTDAMFKPIGNGRTEVFRLPPRRYRYAYSCEIILK